MNNRLILSFAIAALVALPSIASASYTTIATDPSQASNTYNFGSPTAGAPVGYSIAMSDDGTSLKVTLHTTNASDPVAGLFANLYFDTTADTPNTGSNLGFETTNDRAFIPGVPGYTDLASITGYSATAVTNPDGTDTIKVIIPNTFFLDDPLGMGFTKTAPGGNVSLHLSQSFSYTTVGGSTYFPGTNASGGSIELGEAVVNTPAPVPEPAGITYMALSGLGLLAEAGRRLRGRKNA